MKKKILIFLFLTMATTIATALAFEHIGGYVPCYLCLLQRLPYYFALAILLLGFVGYYFFSKKYILNFCLAVSALAMASTAILAIYHSGIEWQFWAGPNACQVTNSAANSDASSLLADLATAKAPACDKASWRFFGLSFAGWNALIAMILTVVALVPLVRPVRIFWRRHHH